MTLSWTEQAGQRFSNMSLYLLDMFDLTRRRGNTGYLIGAITAYKKPAYVVTHTQGYANELSRRHQGTPIRFVSINHADDIRSSDIPVVLDMSVLVTASEAIGEASGLLMTIDEEREHLVSENRHNRTVLGSLSRLHGALNQLYREKLRDAAIEMWKSSMEDMEGG